MDTAQWPQDVGLVKPMENQMVSNASNPNMNSGGANNTAMLEQQRRARPHKEQAINCPRCNSTNTKFCYYNNYSLTQPRYFCKTCRRYWTEGGSLRNVPVGGGSRKNRRSSSSSSITSSVSVSKKLPDLTQPPMINMSSAKSVSHQNPKIHEGQDLNLAFSTSTDHHYHTMSEFAHELPNMDQSNNSNHIPTSSTTTTTHLSALEFLRNGINSKGYGSFMPMAPSSVQDTNTVYSSPSGGFTLQDYKPTTTLNFGVDGYGSIQQGVHHQENSGRPLFPFEDLRQVSNTSEFDHHQNNRGAQGDSNGYWSGMLGGGSW